MLLPWLIHGSSVVYTFLTPAYAPNSKEQLSAENTQHTVVVTVAFLTCACSPAAIITIITADAALLRGDKGGHLSKPPKPKSHPSQPPCSLKPKPGTNPLASHVTNAVETSAKLRQQLTVQEGSPYRELNSSIILSYFILYWFALLKTLYYGL